MKTILFTMLALFFSFNAHANSSGNQVSDKYEQTAYCISVVSGSGQMTQYCF